jgi:Plasmid recombination enzyme
MTHCAVLRVHKLRGAGRVMVAAAHNKRAAQAEHGARGHINPQRTALNEVLHGLPSPEAVAQHARDLMAAAGITKLRKDAVRAVEWLFTLPVNHGVDDSRFFVDCAQWVARHFGGRANLLCADIHRDEAAPHCHVLVLPLMDGKMNGSAAVGGKSKLAALKNDFYDTVAKGYGLKREGATLNAALKHQAAALVLQRFHADADAALASAAWPAIREAIERDPRPFMEILGIDPPQRKLRTVAQVFTSRGKGGKVEPAHRPTIKPVTKATRKAYRLCKPATNNADTEAYAL